MGLLFRNIVRHEELTVWALAWKQWQLLPHPCWPSPPGGAAESWGGPEQSCPASMAMRHESASLLLTERKTIASAIVDSSQTCVDPRVALVLDGNLESQTIPLLVPVYLGAGKQLSHCRSGESLKWCYVMCLHHGKADVIGNSVKSVSSRGNDVVKIDLVVTTLIDMQWIWTLRDTRQT